MTTITLSSNALALLSDTYVVPQRVTSNRRSPWAQELLDARYIEEKPGVGYVITEAGKAHLTALNKARG